MTTTKMAQDTCKYPESGRTLKSILQRIPESQGAEELIKGIRDSLKDYIRDGALDQLEKSPSGHLDSTFKGCKEVLKMITDNSTENCQNTSNTIADELFCLYPCLYYLYFMCCKTDTTFLGGGAWQGERIDQNAAGSGDLHKWLTEIPDNGSPSNLIKGGFLARDKLNTTKKGRDLECPLKKLIHHKTDDGILQKLLYYLLFLSTKWHDGMTGHMLLFLLEFCQMVTKRCPDIQMHNGINPDMIRSNCETLLNTLKYLNTMIAPVRQDHAQNYNNLLDRNKSIKYIEWLRTRIDCCIASLESMKMDCKNWTMNALLEGKSYGPLPWGLMFRNEKWEKHSLRTDLPLKLEYVIKDLERFRELLKGKGNADTKASTKVLQGSNSTSTTGGEKGVKTHEESTENTEGSSKAEKTTTKHEETSGKEISSTNEEASGHQNNSEHSATAVETAEQNSTEGGESRESTTEDSDTTSETQDPETGKARSRTRREARSRRSSTGEYTSQNDIGHEIKMIDISDPSEPNSMSYTSYTMAQTSGSNASSGLSALISAGIATVCLVGSTGYFIYNNVFGVRDKLSGLFR